MAHTHSDRAAGISGDWAFVLTVAAAFASSFLGSSNPLPALQTVALLVMGGVYVLAGIYGFGFCARRRQAWASVVYFGFQISLASAIFYLSRGPGFLIIIVLPLISHGQFLFPGRGALVVAAAILLAVSVTISLLADWGEALRAGATLAAGAIFVFVFTETALRAQQARVEVERLAADLSEANRQLREYAAQVEELATTQERNRLAREIHDSLGHYLTVINVQLEAARAVMDSDRPRTLDALNKAQSLAQEGLADVRRSVAALRAAPTDNRPLPEALAVLADECRASGIVTEFAVRGAVRPLSPQTELTLYRAAQEGLTNIRKHAHASRTEVTLDYGAGGRVRLEVRDNGLGGRDDERGGGYGLLGVRERAQLLGGEVRIHAAQGQGFTLEVDLPT